MATAKVIMYTTPWCGFCAAAKALLKKKGVEFEDIDVSNDAELRDHMISISGRTSVPQIFINDEHIGGFDDMNALDQAGELDGRLGL